MALPELSALFSGYSNAVLNELEHFKTRNIVSFVLPISIIDMLSPFIKAMILNRAIISGVISLQTQNCSIISFSVSVCPTGTEGNGTGCTPCPPWAYHPGGVGGSVSCTPCPLGNIAPSLATSSEQCYGNVLTFVYTKR